MTEECRERFTDRLAVEWKHPKEWTDDNWNKFIKENRERMFYICAHKLGRKCLAEEAAQEVFLRAYEKARDSRFDHGLSSLNYHCP